MNTKKVLVIGLDGATFKLIRPWVNEGKLPNMARLMREGVTGDLESTADMMSPAAWTSFSTGKTPGNHGIYNFLDIIPGTLKMRYLNSTHRDADTIWQLLNRAGKKVAVLNVPMTYPADKVDGVMISGWNAPTIRSAGFSEPPELITDLVKQFGDYELFPVVKKHIAAGEPRKGIAALHRYLDLKAAAAKHLMTTREWDFFCVVFLATDQVQHYYWHYMDKNHPQYDPTADQECRDAILSIYERCDEIIGELTHAAGEDTTVIVMSDHGSGMNHGAVQFLPVWLKKMGFAHEIREEKGNPVSRAGRAARHALIVVLKNVYNFLNRHLSVTMKGFLNALLPMVRDRVESAWRFSTYDWSRTTAFFHYEPRINLKGREPHGTVSPGREYEELREVLIRKLYECRDVKTGMPVVDRVFKGEEVYPHDSHRATAPDIVIRWKENTVISGLVCTDLQGNKIVVTEKNVADQRTGNHEPQGIFLAKGAHLKKGQEITGAAIIDLAPTILSYMGVPVPNDLDGKVLTGIFQPEFLADNGPRYAASSADRGDAGAGYSGADEAAVREHLKDLGYME